MLAPPALVLAATSTTTTPDASSAVEEVVVTGIRHSEEQSLQVKRAADSVVEVITAEDVGKMPDKNVADSLTRVVGVSTSSASANEGGFDENDRVSMRGTSPSLTQTLINGHGVAAGDWFVLTQLTEVGRSVSYTLLPSELINQVVVHKSSEASLVEGGVAGSVDIITRRPLDFSKPLTLQASAGAVYAELPSKTDPQYSALADWKNADATFGILAQGFLETRHLRRDGIEVLGYDQISATSPMAATHPDLANVYYPKEIGAAFFEQKRQRKGGLIDLEGKPSDSVTIDLQGFYSKLDATNYNRNYMEWLTSFVGSGAGQAPAPGYVVTNGTLTSATFAPTAGTLYGVYDQISRPDESATAGYVSLEGNWHASDRFTFSGQLGTSQGDGKTPTQNVSETNPGSGTGAGYTLQGVSAGPNFNLGSNNNTTPFPGGTPVAFNWIFGAQDVDVKDKENWVNLDGQFAMNGDTWTDLKFGVRYQTHERSSDNAIAQGPTFSGPNGGGVNTANYPSTFSTYPSDFNTFGATIPTGIWYWTPAQLAAYNGPGLVQRDPLAREYYQYLYSVKEKNTAAYAQANFKGSNWSGNVGLRLVRTAEDVITYTQTAASTPGAITTSLFGPFVGMPVSNTYNDVLPSANLKVDINPDLVARFAASETMTRADYSALGGFTDLSPPVIAQPGQPQVHGSGSGGNPYLKPIRSTNLDAGLEWYFAKRSLVYAGLFYMDLRNYVSFDRQTISYPTFNGQFSGQLVPYDLTVPVNAQGRVTGFEFAYKQAFADHFGFEGNYTYSDGKQTDRLPASGDDRLFGTSKNTYSLSGYYENQHFSARLSYHYRSAFFSGLDRLTAFSQDSIGDLAASLVYTMNDMWSFTVDGQNLNNPTLKYFALNETQPRAFYKNGAQYYFTVRAKF
jgi:iron complex outermembrane receptor protein